MSNEPTARQIIHELRRALDLAHDELARHRASGTAGVQMLMQRDARIGILASQNAALLRELTILRELSDDVARWRESGGDARDLAYVLETMDKLKARNQ